MKLFPIYESLSCLIIKVTEAMIAEVNRFKTDEDFLRAGGLSNQTLDRAAFGFTEEDIQTLKPEQLKIKWKEDWKNVIWEQTKSGLSKIAWSRRISLDEPIEVVYEKNKFYVDDGHHRLFAAKVLKLPLKVSLIIKQNPITTLAPTLGYDEFHRCLFRQVKSMQF